MSPRRSGALRFSTADDAKVLRNPIHDANTLYWGPEEEVIFVGRISRRNIDLKGKELPRSGGPYEPGQKWRTPLLQRGMAGTENFSVDHVPAKYAPR